MSQPEQGEFQSTNKKRAKSQKILGRRRAEFGGKIRIKKMQT
jgi:hypothetical protein